MVSRDTLHQEILDILNESDETDLDYFIPLSATTSFEDLNNEMDIEMHYRKVNSRKTDRNTDMQSRGHKISKHVQTDPDIDRVPASWLLEGGKLIEELYEGLGNVINVMYHNPESYITASARKTSLIDPGRMKYFKYENGYWHSTLLPNIKIPDTLELDKLNRPLFYEGTKRKLHSLFDVATKLRNIVPYVISIESQQNTQAVEDNIYFRCDNKLSGRFKRNRLPSEPTDYDVDLPKDSFETCRDSGKSSPYSPEYCIMARNVTKRERKENFRGTVNERNAVQDDSHLFDQNPGVRVSKYRFKKQTGSLICDRNFEPDVSNSLKLREMGANAANSKRSGLCIVGESVSGITTTSSNVTASCSNDSKFANKNNKVRSDCKVTQRREKHIFYGQENQLKNKPHHSGSQINFIKRNIMAAKNKANHFGSSAGSNERYDSEHRKTSQNSIPRRVSQNPREKIISSLR